MAPSHPLARFQRLSPEVLEALAFCSSHPRVAEQAAQALFELQAPALALHQDSAVLALLPY